MPLALVDPANTAFNQTIFDQGSEHPVEGLLGDAQNAEQIIHGCSRRTVDEMNRAVMRAPISHVFKDAIRVSRKPPVREEHRFDSLPELFIGQKEQRLAAHQTRSVIHGLGLVDLFAAVEIICQLC